MKLFKIFLKKKTKNLSNGEKIENVNVINAKKIMAVYCFAIKFKNLVKVANILQSLKHIEKECNNTLSLTTTLSK